MSQRRIHEREQGVWTSTTVEKAEEKGKAKMKRPETKHRGIFERVRGSNRWWIRFVDADGKLRREVAGTKSTAIKLYEKRKAAALEGRKLPERLRQVPPTLRSFRERFTSSVETRSAEKPQTIEFYKSKFARLLEFTPLADARLDRLDESLIDSYIQHRRRVVSPASVNRELATLRKALRLAYSWKLINRVPIFHLLDGERERAFVLTHAQERIYLEFAPEPLKSVATLILDTGLRVGEACNLQWPDVHLDAINGARFGYLCVRGGKTKHAKRNVPLTGRVRAILKARRATSRSVWVFPSGDDTGPLSRFTLRDQHTALRGSMRLPSDAVIHSLRHTSLTRLGEAGADPYTIMRVAGHSTITVSQKYVHPSPESIERAFERLELLNARAAKALAGDREPTDTRTDTEPSDVVEHSVQVI